MREKKRELDNYVFLSKRDFIQAGKEKEMVEHMKDSVNWKNPSVAYKLYNKILDRDFFSTVIGIDFLKELRTVIINAGIDTKEGLRPIPVKKQEIKVDAYQEPYENLKTADRIKKIIIFFLLVMIAGMLTVSYFTPYTVFTNYEDKIKDQYSAWEQELREREAALEEKEKN